MVGARAPPFGALVAAQRTKRVFLQRRPWFGRGQKFEQWVGKILMMLPSTLLVRRASGARTRLQEALGAFGSSVLTRREQQVIELVLLGNSTRLVADKLGISAETVKLHRKHAYAKLDISSQAELFYLFVDALASHTGDSGADPLTSYHQHSKGGEPA